MDSTTFPRSYSWEGKARIQIQVLGIWSHSLTLATVPYASWIRGFQTYLFEVKVLVRKHHKVPIK